MTSIKFSSVNNIVHYICIIPEYEMEISLQNSFYKGSVPSITNKKQKNIVKDNKEKKTLKLCFIC